MAERRMFAKTIIDSDAFLDMPLSAQALYFHLSMRADDDGFVNNPKRIQRAIGGSDDDYRILLAKNFIISFDSGVIVIKHWKIHNYIRGDRKKDTAYPEEMSMLSTKENGAYTLLLNNMGAEGIESILDAKDMRKKAYDESELPYSFDYKIRNAFWGKKCPVCGIEMRGFVDECGIATDAHRPTIQHNKPISKGGKHELGNISVICHKCNVTIQDNETDTLNSDEVIEVWDSLSNDSQLTDKCQANVGIGKDSIGKNRLDKSREDIRHKYGEYGHVMLTDKQYQKLIDDYGEDATQKAIKKVDEYCQQYGKSYKDYNLTLRKWGYDGIKTQKSSGSNKDLDEWAARKDGDRK